MTVCCPVCGKFFGDTYNVCPYCGHILNKEKYEVISDYGPSTATAYTTEYTTISAEFEDDIDGIKKKDDLVKEEKLDEEWLSYIVEWGYLDVKKDEYKLTEQGKKALIENRAWKKKKKKNSDGDNQNGNEE